MNSDKIFFDVLSDLWKSKYDSKSTKNEEYAEQLIAVHNEFVKRNEQLTELLTEYISDRKQRIDTNKFLKKFIFWFFIGLLSVLTIGVVVVFWKIDVNSSSVTSVLSLLSVAATYLGSLLSIFKIMSQYLFPSDEEKDAIDMIKAVINNDVKIEDMMSKAIKENQQSSIEKIKECKKLFDEGFLTENEYLDLKAKFISKM